MLVAIAALSLLLIHRGMLLNEARRAEQRRLAEKLRQHEEQACLTAEEAAKIIEEYNIVLIA